MTLYLEMRSQIWNQRNFKAPFQSHANLVHFIWPGLVCMGSLVLLFLTVSEALRPASPHCITGLFHMYRVLGPRGLCPLVFLLPGVSMLHWTLITGPLTRRKCYYLCHFPCSLLLPTWKNRNKEDLTNATRIWPVWSTSSEPVAVSWHLAFSQG